MPESKPLSDDQLVDRLSEFADDFRAAPADLRHIESIAEQASWFMHEAADRGLLNSLEGPKLTRMALEVGRASTPNQPPDTKPEPIYSLVWAQDVKLLIEERPAEFNTAQRELFVDDFVPAIRTLSEPETHTLATAYARASRLLADVIRSAIATRSALQGRQEVLTRATYTVEAEQMTTTKNVQIMRDRFMDFSRQFTRLADWPEGEKRNKESHNIQRRVVTDYEDAKAAGLLPDMHGYGDAPELRYFYTERRGEWRELVWHPFVIKTADAPCNVSPDVNSPAWLHHAALVAKALADRVSAPRDHPLVQAVHDYINLIAVASRLPEAHRARFVARIPAYWREVIHHAKPTADSLRHSGLGVGEIDALLADFTPSHFPDDCAGVGLMMQRIDPVLAALRRSLATVSIAGAQTTTFKPSASGDTQVVPREQAAQLDIAETDQAKQKAPGGIQSAASRPQDWVSPGKQADYLGISKELLPARRLQITQKARREANEDGLNLKLNPIPGKGEHVHVHDVDRFVRWHKGGAKALPSKDRTPDEDADDAEAIEELTRKERSRQREIWECKTCGHGWPAAAGAAPKCCPKQNCNSEHIERIP